jgi:Domain of unknown function (DUF4160)
MPAISAFLWDLDPHVLQRPSSTAFSRSIRRVRSHIGTLEVIEGQLPRRALNLVREWAMMHREELLEDWRFCRENTPPAKIEPLA